MNARWTVSATPQDDPEAVALVRRYLAEVIGRFYQRPATEEEIDRELVDDPADDAAVFLVARHDGVPAGCAAVRLLGRATAELKRVYVAAEHRRTGGAALLLAEAERAAAGLGATALRLDTRRDLVEARALYARHGYAEIERYHDGPYADHFYEKALR
ncbi:GNAT family N-acetyltransferase [Umezawaea beigongshangensis]|uniref:GNAT family N-acetyltransferase n=1 Tax=Umezawaea beigongshangensis TaxID=2780383 RepID=UPI0018F1CF5B|nr:GNAT family N-acetyltransferase [Umezawaea beigongshangensis]